MYYPRRILPLLKKQLSTKEIVVLTGMRRTGKTTLYRMIFDEIKSENKAFLDIENPIEQKIFEEKDFRNIWANLKAYQIAPEKKAYLFLDEIQAYPPIVKAIKYLYDHYQIKFFLTGSSSYYLKNLFPESLAGRKLTFELNPLDFSEFLIFKGTVKTFHPGFKQMSFQKNLVMHEKVKKLYAEYLSDGGFPEVVLEKNKQQRQYKLLDIFKSYFEKDVRLLSDFRNISRFRDLILLLMQRVGSKLEIAKLSSELGLSRDTIYSYLTFLEGTYFIHLIEPFSRSVDREVSGTKKIYFCDTGLVNHLAQISGGALLENAVFNNLKKYGQQINYYQKRSGAEIDFVIDKKIAIEVKQKASIQVLKRLATTAKQLRISEYYLATHDFSDLDRSIPVTEI